MKSASGSQSELLFADGQYHAGLKLYRFGERWYNPALGRWTQQDPLHQPYDPREANRYAYVGGDPVNLTDPNGLFSLDPGDALDALSAVSNLGSAAAGMLGFMGSLQGCTGLTLASRGIAAPFIAGGCATAIVGSASLAGYSSYNAGKDIRAIFD